MPVPETQLLWNCFTITGDTLSVTIDGKETGTFTSPGIAHPTKKMLRFSVPRNAVVVDVKIYRKSASFLV